VSPTAPVPCVVAESTVMLRALIERLRRAGPRRVLVIVVAAVIVVILAYGNHSSDNVASGAPLHALAAGSGG